MKKIGLLLVVLCMTLTVNAQKKYEDAAKATIEEIKTAISITDAQASDLYELELQKNIDIADIKKENKGDKKTIQAEMKIVKSAAYQAAKKIIGKEKMEELSAYKKAQRNKSK
tara:strand:+ start:28846 stop:29184 length:339 start_codon:yes stop_codon:yes gene_type:complete